MIFLINLNDSKYIYGIWFVFCYGLRLVWLALSFLARIEASFLMVLLLRFEKLLPLELHFDF